jgi:hypothetical protein
MKEKGKVITKAYRRSRGISPLILNFSTRWRWVISFMSQPLYPGSESDNHWLGGWMGLKPVWTVLEKGKHFTSAGIRNPDRQAPGIKFIKYGVTLLYRKYWFCWCSAPGSKPEFYCEHFFAVALLARCGNRRIIWTTAEGDWQARQNLDLCMTELLLILTDVEGSFGTLTTNFIGFFLWLRNRPTSFLTAIFKPIWRA